MMGKIINLFPLWAIILSSVAYRYPELFVPFKNVIVPLLAIVMLCMGMTLNWRDFRTVLKQPVIIVIAASIQFILMPLFAYGLSTQLGLSTEVLTGMVLVGVSAGGTASNVICYLAKGDVALSILMTLFSTLCAVLLMPWLTFLYLNQLVPVPVDAMIKSIVMIVLLPVLLGTLLNSIFSRHIKNIQAISPLISSLAIVWIIAIIVGLNHDNLSDLALPVLFAVCLHNLLGLVFGYYIPKLLNFDERICRTVCIEVGMQNSGLSVALAIKHFSMTAALPGAVFSIWHNISGSFLALFWRIRNGQK